MQYCLAVFKSRNETLYFVNLLMKNGYKVGVVNTPREVGQACGISVQFSPKLTSIARALLATKPFNSFAGFYQVSIQNGRMSVAKC